MVRGKIFHLPACFLEAGLDFLRFSTRFAGRLLRDNVWVEGTKKLGGHLAERLNVREVLNVLPSV